MKKLLPTDKGIQWYLEQMQHHVEEIKELLGRGDEIYKGDETYEEHARVEAYDLIVLTAEAFDMPEILESVPDEIIERFNRKRGKA
ncbi:MAG: hypothetical protein KJ928_00945 [Candidatus Altiarchaeota archaeon]|nr:hypothetical protein [Candidatus Altiarchaeota archaeon]MBU4437129.1 hypothetical protein [Candidatus Altiarchaeota archaeon]